MQIQTILLPVDGSEHSVNAARYAADLAKTTGASIVLLHCHRAVPLALGEPNFQNAVDQYAADSDRVLDPFRRLLDDAGVDYQDRVVGGRAAEVIAEVAGIEECDLVVMGSKGKSDLEGLFVGSVTHKVLNTAPCPVLVVR